MLFLLQVTHGARPKPHMVYRNLDLLDVSPIQAVVKVTSWVQGTRGVGREGRRRVWWGGREEGCRGGDERGGEKGSGGRVAGEGVVGRVLGREGRW